MSLSLFLSPLSPMSFCLWMAEVRAFSGRATWSSSCRWLLSVCAVAGIWAAPGHISLSSTGCVCVCLCLPVFVCKPSCLCACARSAVARENASYNIQARCLGAGVCHCLNPYEGSPMHLHLLQQASGPEENHCSTAIPQTERLLLACLV